MKTGERDASVDRLLPGVLKARAEETGRGCLDAETLAAWADAALSGRERADAEAHAANCARCQAMLAAMVRIEPAPTAAVSSPFRTRALWWMAAFAPIAAAVVIWFAVPNRAPVQHSQSVDAIAEPAAPAPSAAEPSSTSKLRAPDSIAETRAQAQNEAVEKEKVAPQRAVAPRLDAAPADQSLRDQKTLAAPAETSAIAAERAAAGVPAAAPAPAAEAAAAPSANLRREAMSAPARQSAFASPEAVIVSSNPSTRFRLLTGGGVQRSADGGATWRTEVTGVTETLTAGASPSPSVCWLIGRSGIVLLSTDGRTWRRVTAPAAVELRAIAATDQDNASVTTTDGRVFVTADGGQTWARPPDF